MASALKVPSVPFNLVARRIARLSDPFERNAHQVVYGTTGSGKSYLIRHGILPIWPYARTVILDVKSGRDRTWQDYGAPVEELPPAFAHLGDGPAKMRYRLIVRRADAKQQIRRLLEQVRDEGHCVLVIDESRSVTEREQIGLGSLVENLILEGRGLGITLIMGAQSTAWAVSALKDQPSAFWIGRQRHQKQAMELATIAGYGRELVPTISAIPPRHWLYGDAHEDDPILAITSVPVRGADTGGR